MQLEAGGADIPVKTDYGIRQVMISILYDLDFPTPERENAVQIGGAFSYNFSGDLACSRHVPRSIRPKNHPALPPGRPTAKHPFPGRRRDFAGGGIHVPFTGPRDQKKGCWITSAS